MLINPDDADDQHLVGTIEVATRRLRSEDAQDAETEADIRTTVKLAQAILRREWQRVKLGT